MHPMLAKAKFDKDLAGVAEELCEMRAWTVFKCEYPFFDVGFRSPQGASLRIRMECENWNEDPPAVELLNWGGEYLTQMPPSSTGIFHAGPHKNTGRSFVCMKGTREYHTHDSHLLDHWHTVMSSADYRLGEIATQIWNAWRKANP